MRKISVSSRLISKARQNRRKRVEAMPNSPEKSRMKNKTYRQVDRMHKSLKVRQSDPNLKMKLKATDPRTTLIRKFRPKSVPKHKKFLNFIANLL